MAYGDLDKKASEKYVPSKFIKVKADKAGADIRYVKSEEEARRIIKEAEEDKKGTAPVKDGEVLSPLRNGHDRTHHGSQIVVHIPAVHANIAVNQAPAWHEIVATVKDAVLWMVLGGALTFAGMRAIGL